MPILLPDEGVPEGGCVRLRLGLFKDGWQRYGYASAFVDDRPRAYRADVAKDSRWQQLIPRPAHRLGEAPRGDLV